MELLEDLNLFKDKENYYKSRNLYKSLLAKLVPENCKYSFKPFCQDDRIANFECIVKRELKLCLISYCIKLRAADWLTIQFWNFWTKGHST